MPNRTLLTRVALAATLVSALVFVSATGPSAAYGAVPVTERCADGSLMPPGGLQDCPEPVPVPTNLGPIIALAVAIAAVALLAAAFLILRRQSKAPLAPADPGEWWTCPKCGSTNVIGSARCYSCGTWQR